MPVTYPGDRTADTVTIGDYTLEFSDKEANYVDKIVSVTNTGKSEAYVRTLVAVPTGGADWEPSPVSANNCWLHWNMLKGYNEHWTLTTTPNFIEIDGEGYYVWEFVHKEALQSGKTTFPVIKGFYMDQKVDHDDEGFYMTYADGTTKRIEDVAVGDSLNVLVLTQAVQAAGFDNAETALNTGFGDVTDVKAAEWFDGVIAENNGIPKDAVAVSSFEELKKAIAEGSNIRLTANISVPETLNVSESAAIYGQGHTIARAEGYTGTVFSVSADSNLTMENITLDGSGATATGNLIATEGNGSIVLNEGTVVQNNNGAHAISLATRGGGSLTLNGAQVLNNSSDSGAIWAGGDVIVNEGSKISNNSSTGLGGAIRMVSGSAFTMNGGEISNNTAATDGGAIWGYNASGYYFNGGSIENNSAQGVGGAVYAGQGSQFYISDDFVMTNNTATDSGAIRFTSGCQLHMTGGKISGNTSSDSGVNYSYNSTTNITGGVFSDNLAIGGWVGSTTVGNSFTGVLKLGMYHKNVQLTDNFDGVKFEIIDVETTYADYKFIPAEGYTYTEGDETKLICMNDGYEVYWDADSSTFKVQANN